jgi:hypothetical protein
MHARMIVLALFAIGLDFAPTVGSAQQDASEAQAADAADDGFLARFMDPSDGRFDLTAGGDDDGTAGFLPLAIPGNEPTFGPNLLMALVYFHENREATPPPPGTPPTMSFGGAGVSENDSWAAAGGHYSVRDHGRHRYITVVGRASVNLGFYGVDSEERVRSDPLDFNIEGAMLVQSAAFKLGNSDFFAGARLTYLAADVSFDIVPDDLLGLGRVHDGGITVSLSYDTRDTTFTPSRGTSATAAVSSFTETLGGDFSYQKLDLRGIHYTSALSERLTLGLRAEYHFASDGVPFFSLPWVSLRGIPILRYVGNHAITAEIEPRYKLDERWSVLGFAGFGRAAAQFDDLGDAEHAYNYGIGFRYLLARKLGLAGGFDLARGPDDTTLYITIGNAWSL